MMIFQMTSTKVYQELIQAYHLMPELREESFKVEIHIKASRIYFQISKASNADIRKGIMQFLNPRSKINREATRTYADGSRRPLHGLRSYPLSI